MSVRLHNQVAIQNQFRTFLLYANPGSTLVLCAFKENLALGPESRQLKTFIAQLKISIFEAAEELNNLSILFYDSSIKKLFADLSKVPRRNRFQARSTDATLLMTRQSFGNIMQ